MAESILCFSRNNSWTVVHSRRTNSHIHWILQVVGAGLSIAGCVIEYFDRPTHFGSIHSVTGISLVSKQCLYLLFINMILQVSYPWCSCWLLCWMVYQLYGRPNSGPTSSQSTLSLSTISAEYLRSLLVSFYSNLSNTKLYFTWYYAFSILFRNG